MSEPYARFYYAKFIVEFPHIYADDVAFAAWMRMLATAEAMWPVRPEVPRSVRTKTLAKLVAVDLIETDGLTYSVRGLDAERLRRSDAARNAAASRWHSGRHSEGNADVMPSTRTRRDETNLPPPPTSGGRRKDGTNPRAIGSSPRQSGQAPRDLGESPRQVQRAEKRDMTPIHVILARAAANGGDA